MSELSPENQNDVPAPGKPTEQEIERAVEVLRKLEPGVLPRPVFEEVARLVPMSTVEMVPLRQSREGKLQVLMTRRDEDDPHWPNQLHVPGAVMLATDPEGTYEGTIGRVLSGELGGSVVGEPVFVKQYHHQVARGREFAHAHYIEVGEGVEPTVGEWLDVDDLPPDTIEHHAKMVPEVAQAYLERKTAEN